MMMMTLSPRRLNIALFGTSADPPTAGHKAILRWLSQQFDQVAVWASDNPFKSHQTPLKHRERMLRVMIESLETPNVQLHEALSSPRSLETVEKAQKMWPNADHFWLVVGSDLVSQIHHWYQVETLLSQVKLLIIPRPGYPITDEAIASLDDLGADYQLADLEVPQVSSTAYRRDHDSEIVTQPVEDYIRREKLYA